VSDQRLPTQADVPAPPPGPLPAAPADPTPGEIPAAVDPGAQAPPASGWRRRGRLAGLRAVGSGVVAVSVKELRGRMRGKRAFAILTGYLLLVAGFAWMLESITERAYAGGFGNSFSAAAEIGRGLFLGIITLLTLVTLILAPASTAGAISLEREKQTLDLLVTTPISSLAIVLGKLFSALSWIFLLLLASIPVAAIVFTFGGVAPDDVLRAYVVLFATAICFGAIGLFVSALVKRTQAATVISLVLAILLTAGVTFVFVFWVAMTGSGGAFPDQPSRGESFLDSLSKRPPEALEWWNPFVAQLDVMCGTETGFGASCQVVSGVTGSAGSLAQDGGFGLQRYWPRSIAALTVTAVILVLASVQLVSPTRRWRLRRGRRQSTASDRTAA
jgi:ABC-2 type transport system permease protein